jgi:hypothetical protein
VNCQLAFEFQIRKGHLLVSKCVGRLHPATFLLLAFLSQILIKLGFKILITGVFLPPYYHTMSGGFCASRIRLPVTA